jgi:ankyrin repeat protein
MKALVSAGADVNAVCQDGRTALHYAAHYNCPDTIDALLAAGADAGARDKHGKTALAVAMHFKNAAAVSRLSELGLPDTIARRLLGSAQRLFTRRSL